MWKYGLLPATPADAREQPKGCLPLGVRKHRNGGSKASEQVLRGIGTKGRDRRY